MWLGIKPRAVSCIPNPRINFSVVLFLLICPSIKIRGKKNGKERANNCFSKIGLAVTHLNCQPAPGEVKTRSGAQGHPQPNNIFSPEINKERKKKRKRERRGPKERTQQLADLTRGLEFGSQHPHDDSASNFSPEDLTPHLTSPASYTWCTNINYRHIYIGIESVFFF